MLEYMFLKKSKDLHFFPPNPFKIGDCILTWSIVMHYSKLYDRIIYYGSKLICDTLKRFEINNVNFEVVSNIEDSCKKAYLIRNNNSLRSVDLQQLNCYLDFIEFRHLFDANIPLRCKSTWDDESFVRIYGVQSFANIFRQILSIPDTKINIPILSNSTARSNTILVFPHACTSFQQISYWPEILDKIMALTEVIVVGKGIVCKMFNWPQSTSFLTDLTGDEIVDQISNAKGAVGCATGLTHIAAACCKPTMFIWNFNDSDIFQPINNDVCSHLMAEDASKEEIIEKVELFVKNILQISNYE